MKRAASPIFLPPVARAGGRLRYAPAPKRRLEIVREQTSLALRTARTLALLRRARESRA